MNVRNEELRKLLEEHGLAVSLYKSWLVVNGSLPGIRCMYEPQKDSAILLFEVLLENESIIEECLVGIGSTEEEAFLNGMVAFSLSSLHVLLGALWGKTDEEQITVENWSFGDADWIAYIGNFVKRATDGKAVPIPENLFDKIEAEITREPLSENQVWARMFYCNVDEKEQVAEFLVNNEKRPESEIRIKSLEWPKLDYFYSVRNFLVLKKQ